MKTQIIKIIPCLLAGFILSACVGAVNVPSEIAEKVIKNTDPDPVVEKDTIVIVDDKEPEPEPEPEPIVISPEAALINRCIIDDNLKDSSCTSIVSEHSCITDPFGVACDITFTDYYKTAQANRISFCIIGKNASDSFCDTAVAEQPCIEDPFIETCNANTDFANHYQTAQTNRINFCITGANASNTLCRGVDTAINNCITNPFGVGCNTNMAFIDYHQTAIDNHLTYCRDNINPSFCTFVIAKTCSTTGNPFDPLCSDSQYQPIRTEHLTFCGIEENINDPICANTLSRPTAASWIQSFGNSIPTQENFQYAQGGGKFVQDVTTSSLNLADATYAEKPLGGDSTDGVHFYIDSFSSIYESVSYYRAGILSSTDLGASRIETEGTVTWNGQFQTINQNNYFSGTQDFTLTINFGAGKQAGTIAASVGYYSLTGDFDSNGVIKGTTAFIDTDGTLHGLIGQEGAIGVFVSNTNSYNSRRATNKTIRPYAGGFVARPPDE